MSDLNELFFAFTEHMKVKNYSPSTMDSYGSGLRTFFDYLTEKNIMDIKRVTRDLLKDYQLLLFERKEAEGHAISTIAIKIRAVKRFFEQLEASSQVLVNPAEHLKEPRVPARLPRTVLTESEARKILDQPNLGTMTGIRDRCVLEVFYSTGIRLEELTNLTIFDCDLQGGLLRVNKGKFSKDRVVPLGKHAVRFLKEYITRVRPQHTKNNKQTRTLFMNQFGATLSKQVIELLVRTYAKKSGIAKRVTPHTFRHTFATELIRNGADINSVREMLGHSDVKTTNIYTHVAGVDVKRTHSTSHPREKDKTESEEITPDIKRKRDARNP